MNEKYKESITDIDVPVAATTENRKVTCTNEEPVNSNPEVGSTDIFIKRYCATDRVYSKITERSGTNLTVKEISTRILQVNSPSTNSCYPPGNIGSYKQGQLLIIHPLLRNSQSLDPARCSFFTASGFPKTFRCCNRLNENVQITLEFPLDTTISKPTSVLIAPGPVHVNDFKPLGSKESFSKRVPQRRSTKWRDTTVQKASEELKKWKAKDVCKLFTTPTYVENSEEYLSQLTHLSDTFKISTKVDSEMAKTLATPEMHNTLAVCQNCGVKSKNLSFCDFCKRAIPKNAKHMPDTDATQPVPQLRTSPSSEEKNVEQKSSQKRDQNEGESSEEKIIQQGNAKRKKFDNRSDIPKPGCGVNNDTQPVSSGAQANRFSGLHANNVLIIPEDEEMFRCKNQILVQLKDQSNCSAEVLCRSIRLGTYRSIGAKDPLDENNVIVRFTKAGIMFEMSHYKEPATKVELVIPKSAILYSGVSITCKAIPFIVVRTGGKIAKWMCKKLGIEPADEVKFMPTSRTACEQNIVFYAWEFSDEAKSALKVMPCTRTLTKNEANELLKKIALPEALSRLPEFPVLTTIRRKSPKLSTSQKEKSPAPIKKTITKVKDNYSTQKIVIKETKCVATKTISTIVATQSLQSANANKEILGKGKVSFPLCVKDLYSAKPGEFLNDQIIDFWLEYVLENVLSEADRKRTHLFSTFYYNRLTQKENGRSIVSGKKLTPAEKRHTRVKKWTKKVDIFSKDFIIVPINENCHWYVAIICFPGLEGPEWVSDGTPVKGWRNIGYRNGKPVYLLPPGMVERTDDLPPWRKQCLEKDISQAKKAVPLKSDEPNSTPPEKMNGETFIDEAKKLKTNPTTIIQVNGQISNNESNSKVIVSMSQGATSKKPEVIVKYFTAAKMPGTSEVLLKDEFTDLEIREEADPDEDEETLFEDYYLSDSEDNDREDGKIVERNGETASESTIDTGIEKQETAEKVIDHNKEELVKIEEVATPKMEVKSENEATTSDELPSLHKRTDFRIRQPCILVFDSLSSGISKSKVYGTLREYLEMEHKVRKGSVREFSKHTMPGFTANCPQQPNFSDCGVYLLQYVEQFFKTPLDSYLLALPYSLKRWFPPLISKRKEIYETISDLVKTENPENLKLIPPFETSQIRTATPKAEIKTSTSKDPNKDKSGRKLFLSNLDAVPEAACFISTPDPSPDMSPSKLVSDSLAMIPPSAVSETMQDIEQTEEVNVPPLPCETLDQIVQMDHNYNSESTESSEPKDEDQSIETMQIEASKFDVSGVIDEGADICSFRAVHFSPIQKLENVEAAEEPMDIDV